MKVMKAVLVALSKYEMRGRVKSYGQAEQGVSDCHIHFVNGWEMTISRQGQAKRRPPEGYGGNREWEDLGWPTFYQIGVAMEATSRFFATRR